MNISYNSQYKLLSIKQSASLSDAKIAYRRLIQKWHPDRFDESSKEYAKAHDQFLKLTKAFDQLHAFHHQHARLPLESKINDKESEETFEIDLSRRNSNKGRNSPTRMKNSGGIISFTIGLALCIFLVYSSNKESSTSDIKAESYKTQSIHWNQQLDHDIGKGQYLGTTKTSVGDTLSRQLYR